ncbi:divergent polysaccharide deacetylase family protein [Henriciella sp.]|uniref:divergent polysaccharide deacetylase family protein n=1 Tax=Henriciella sp. TaxID=1968823 RepID=UPI0026203586|nr:divergent polysaccharide deacetylase family protein [Henriciella sp.]
MMYRVTRDPSPVRSGLVHTGLSLLAFSALMAVSGTLIHLTGDASEAGPARQIALFEPAGGDRPNLKTRFAAEDGKARPVVSMMATAEGPSSAVADSTEEQAPSLGVSYAGDDGGGAARPSAMPDEVDTVRINGVAVSAGRSWKETTKLKALPEAPISAVTETAPVGPLPRVADDGRTPAGAYARPFANPENRPKVAIVVGGLGINWRHTTSAIEELPPEITLSFAPTASNLQGWIDQARKAGHEVLLEVPMEPYEFGRESPHSHTLYGEHDDERTRERLEYLLSRATGYFGVTNYQGSKFATDEASTTHLADTLHSRGLALVEDGSLSRSAFTTAAQDTGLRFRKANTPVDARPEGEEIETKLLELEALAMESGSSLGTGFAYPLTIDILKEWTQSLDEKGIILAPASSVTQSSRPAGKSMDTAELVTEQGGQTGG